jgi:hypothetical protein
MEEIYKINHGRWATSYQWLDKNRKEVILVANDRFFHRLSRQHLGGTFGLGFQPTIAFLSPYCLCVRIYVTMLHIQIPIHLERFQYMLFFFLLLLSAIHVPMRESTQYQWYYRSFYSIFLLLPHIDIPHIHYCTYLYHIFFVVWMMMLATIIF